MVKEKQFVLLYIKSYSVSVKGFCQRNRRNIISVKKGNGRISFFTQMFIYLVHNKIILGSLIPCLYNKRVVLIFITSTVFFLIPSGIVFYKITAYMYYISCRTVVVVKIIEGTSAKLLFHIKYIFRFCPLNPYMDWSSSATIKIFFSLKPAKSPGPVKSFKISN